MNKRTVLGPALILIGAYLFLNRGMSFGTESVFGLFWPTLFLIPVGLFFHWLYFFMTERKGVGLLIPGGIIFTAGITCQLAALFHSWSYMWPGFIFAVAVGLFEFYWFGKRNKWLLIPINILTVLSLLFFAVFSIGTFFNTMSTYRTFIAIAFIAAGAAAVFIPKKRY
jgi:hypothetical protein